MNRKLKLDSHEEKVLNRILTKVWEANEMLAKNFCNKKKYDYCSNKCPFFYKNSICLKLQDAENELGEMLNGKDYRKGVENL